MEKIVNVCWFVQGTREDDGALALSVGNGDVARLVVESTITGWVLARETRRQTFGCFRGWSTVGVCPTVLAPPPKKNYELTNHYRSIASCVHGSSDHPIFQFTGEKSEIGTLVAAATCSPAGWTEIATRIDVHASRSAHNDRQVVVAPPFAASNSQDRSLPK